MVSPSSSPEADRTDSHVSSDVSSDAISFRLFLLGLFIGISCFKERSKLEVGTTKTNHSTSDSSTSDSLNLSSKIVLSTIASGFFLYSIAEDTL
jgi:hypothetical protein